MPKTNNPSKLNQLKHKAFSRIWTMAGDDSCLVCGKPGKVQAAFIPDDPQDWQPEAPAGCFLVVPYRLCGACSNIHPELLAELCDNFLLARRGTWYQPIVGHG
jgi:hypothetical protein